MPTRWVWSSRTAEGLDPERASMAREVLVADVGVATVIVTPVNLASAVALDDADPARAVRVDRGQAHAGALDLQQVLVEFQRLARRQLVRAASRA